MGKIKERSISLIVQAKKIEKDFPNSKVLTTPSKLIWKGRLQPSILGEAYDIQLNFKEGYHPDVFVINKKLQLYPGKKRLPHVYNSEKQWLCLYFRKAKEWKKTKFISDTIIPWTSEWLLHYEYWLCTGKWHGRGIHGKPEPFISKKSSYPVKL